MGRCVEMQSQDEPTWGEIFRRIFRGLLEWGYLWLEWQYLRLRRAFRQRAQN